MNPDDVDYDLLMPFLFFFFFFLQSDTDWITAPQAVTDSRMLISSPLALSVSARDSCTTAWRDDQEITKRNSGYALLFV